jgi:hypothetical protein
MPAIDEQQAQEPKQKWDLVLRQAVNDMDFRKSFSPTRSHL